MSKPVLRPSPGTRATGDGDIAHTINRSGLQPCSTCKQHDHAHLVPTEGHCRTWAVFCEQHCPVRVAARAVRLRERLSCLSDAHSPSGVEDDGNAAEAA